MAITSYTPAQAREHIYATFMNTWQDPDKGWQGLVDVFGNAITLTDEPQLEWDNDIGDDPPCVNAPLVYLYVRHYASKQAHIGGVTRKSFTRKGFVLARVWVPQDTGLKTGDALSYVIKTAFEGRRALGDGKGILFRSWRPTESGNTSASQGRFQIVSTVDFEYDEHTLEDIDNGQ